MTPVSVPIEIKRAHLLRAPTLNYTSEHHLFWIIGDECNQVKDYTPEMTVRASADHWRDHPCTEWA